MTEDLLFRWLPYGALVVFSLGLVVRLGRVVRPASPPPTGSTSAPRRGFSWGSRSWRSLSWRIGLAGLVLGHLMGLLAPGVLVALHQHPIAQLVVEGLAVAFGCAALFGLLLEIFVTDGDLRPRSLLDTLGLTLLGLVLVSGLSLALLFRSTPAWYATVLTPYLGSLLTLEPRVALVSPLPFWARLHLLTVFLLLAVGPWTTAGAFVVARLRGRRHSDSPRSPRGTARNAA